jgi:hypothetical protein
MPHVFCNARNSGSCYLCITTRPRRRTTAGVSVGNLFPIINHSRLGHVRVTTVRLRIVVQTNHIVSITSYIPKYQNRIFDGRTTKRGDQCVIRNFDVTRHGSRINVLGKFHRTCATTCSRPIPQSRISKSGANSPTSDTRHLIGPTRRHTGKRIAIQIPF